MSKATQDIRLTEALILRAINRLKEKNYGESPKKIYISSEIYLMYKRYQNLIAYEKEPETLYGIPVEVDYNLRAQGYYFKNEYDEILI